MIAAKAHGPGARRGQSAIVPPHPAAAAVIAAAGGELAPASLARAAVRVELPPAARSYLRAPDERTLAADLEWLAASGTVIILSTDPGYPPLLKQTAGAPAALYVQGSVPLAASHSRSEATARSSGALR